MKTENQLDKISPNDDIQKKLSDLGYKIAFSYKDGKLDTVYIAQWSNERWNFRKKYNLNDIYRILFNDFITLFQDEEDEFCNSHGQFGGFF